MTTNQTIATRCLDAAADIDFDESASPLELCEIAQTIANRLYPTRFASISTIIHNLTCAADNHQLADHD